MLKYKIVSESKNGGKAIAIANKSTIEFDATAGRDDRLPNPAELLITAISACILKNVERYSGILHLPYKSARVSVSSVRDENPPSLKSIEYVLEIETDIDEKKLNMWHKNIIKFGTISNTLAKATDLKGEIKYLVR